MTTRDLAVVIVAAGKGERLGAAVPKAFFEIAGQTLLRHAASRILGAKGLAQLVVAAPADRLDLTRSQIEQLLDEHSIAGQIQLDVVAGGATRQQSISNAVRNLKPGVDVVLVHDAARAFAPTELFDRVADTVRFTGSGAVPVEPVVDTIKRVEGDVVLETVDRSNLRKAQTPQGFKASDLMDAYAAAEADFTDDAALLQSRGHEVLAVEGDARALKITTAQDVDAAYSLLFGSADQRIGIGTDTHRFTADPAKPLYLGTVEWAGEPGLDGHSDGDAVSHAIVDAMLSALGLGDIGTNFGVDRPEFAGANGAVFLTASLDMIQRAGWRIANVSVQIIGNRPKVAPHRIKVEQVLTELLQAPVSLGATTTDGLGFLGNSEGVAAVATVLLQRAEDRLEK